MALIYAYITRCPFERLDDIWDEKWADYEAGNLSSLREPHYLWADPIYYGLDDPEQGGFFFKPIQGDKT